MFLVDRISTTDRKLQKICRHVLEIVCDILDDVISKMEHKRLVSWLSDQTLYELGFKCPKHLNDDHLIINRSRPIGGVKSTVSNVSLVKLPCNQKKVNNDLSERRNLY